MEGYGSRFIETLFGVGLSTLHYWDKQRVVRPSVRPAAGSGSKRLYSFRDLVALKTVCELRSKHVPLQRIRSSVKFLREVLPELDNPLSELAFVTDGESVFVRTDDPQTLMDTLKEQFVWAVPVASWAREVQDAVQKCTTAVEDTITVEGRTFTYTVEQDPEDGWWVGFVVELPGCGTQAGTRNGLRAMIADAIACYLSVGDEEREDAAKARQVATR